MNRFPWLPRILRVWYPLRRFFKMVWLVLMLRRQAACTRKAIPVESTGFRCQPKPEWVRKEVIRLKAFMIHDGCRKVAETFNRLHQHKRKMTVGKTYVYETIKKHRYEIQVLRRKIKHRKPRLLPKNLIWSLDLTQVPDDGKQPHTLFGILDSGTRACLKLQAIRTKTSIMLLRCLLDTVERYGKPKIVRTDNERTFTSRLFRLGLWLIGIKHQRTEVCCPWQNGKIERFFGTLKEKLKSHVFEGTEILADDLHLFRFWYNHVRPHQHLNGRTPAEAWSGQVPNLQGKHYYFNQWNGALTGFYLPPS